MTGRPASLLVAIVVLAVEGVGALLFAALVAALRGWVLADVRYDVEVLVAASVGFALPCLVAAAGAWAGRSWSWLVGVVIQSIVLMGVAAAIVSGGWHPALLVAIALAGTGAAALFNPATRRALGV